MESTTVHPDAVLEAILAKGHRSQKLNSLKQLHAICAQHYQSQQTKLRDFSLAAIGRICEQKGLFKARMLYNKQSADYVDLITAWAAFSGPSSVKAPKEPKVLASHEYLMKIEDPAIRRIVQAKFSELDKVRAQLNLLKSHTKLVINQQPLGATLTEGTPGMPVLLMNARLTDSERNALEKAVSKKFINECGWEEGSHGQIKQGTRTLFDVGFTTAIRKVLAGG